MTSLASVPPAKAAPGCRYAPLPMRKSLFSPRSTSAASAPTCSQIRESSLINATDVAKNALIACFVISADSIDIHSMGRDNGSQIGSSSRLSSVERIPTTTRSGCMKVSIALPSRKFSGAQANRMWLVSERSL